MPADFNFLTQMRRIGFLFSFVAFMMISCAKETVTVTGDSAGPMGEVTIALASVDGHHNALPVKSTVEVPDAGDFKIEIFNAEGVRLYRDTYANSENKKIPLPGIARKCSRSRLRRYLLCRRPEFHGTATDCRDHRGDSQNGQCESSREFRRKP